MEKSGHLQHGFQSSLSDGRRVHARSGLAAWQQVVITAKAQLHQAQVNLDRTRILSPVDGYVTNLLAQLGDYVNVGVNAISLVDADSFWVDGYFEETNLAPVERCLQPKFSDAALRHVRFCHD
jgi:multidrug resistance efflux pump